MGLFQVKGKEAVEGSNCRRHERHQLEVVRCELGEVIDLSRSGVCIATKGKPPVRPNQTADLTLKFNGRQICVAAQARWVKRIGLRSYHIGLMFANISTMVGLVLESVAKFGFVDPVMLRGSIPKAKNQTRSLVKAMIELPDYYQLLGVGSNASNEDLHRAYRRLAQVHHPDVNKKPNAANRFITIKQAYEVLSDPEQRLSYDRQMAAYGGRDLRVGTS